MDKIIYSGKPKILRNNDFQTIQIKVAFPYKTSVEDLAKIQLLPPMINHINNKYKTEEEMQKEKKRLFILSSSVYNCTIGDIGCLSFNLIVPDKQSLGEVDIEKQLEFFRNFIYNPFVENDKFSEFELEREIKNLKLSMDNAFKNLRPYHGIKLKELIDDVGILTRDVIYHQDLIEKVTTSNLYDFYNQLVTNNKPAIFIMGNVDDNISDLCQKYLYLNEFDSSSIEGNLFNFFDVRNDITNVTEKSNFKDSSLSYVYKIKDMKEDEYVKLNLIRDLLNSLSSRLLDKKLRDENELIYSGYAMSYPHYGAFEITTFINKNNVDLVKEKIPELISDIKNTKLIEPLLDNIKDRKRINLLRKPDDKYAIFGDFVSKELGIDDTEEEYFELVKKVTAKDLSIFVDRFVLDTIYYLEEEENE